MPLPNINLRYRSIFTTNKKEREKKSMNEQVKRYYDYLVKQQELCVRWINEALEKRQNIKTLNSRYEFITSCIDSFKYYFRDYLVDVDVKEYEALTEELPGFED